jgi:hypothetical protein
MLVDAYERSSNRVTTVYAELEDWFGMVMVVAYLKA